MWGKIVIWLAKAWVWIKKNWKWILFPIGILAALATVLGVFFRPKPPVPPVPDLKPTTGVDIAIHDNQTAGQVQAAEVATAAEIKAIEEKHQATLDALKDSQRLQYEEMKKKPAQEITNWLLEVGKGSK